MEMVLVYMGLLGLSLFLSILTPFMLVVFLDFFGVGKYHKIYAHPLIFIFFTSFMFFGTMGLIKTETYTPPHINVTDEYLVYYPPSDGFNPIYDGDIEYYYHNGSKKHDE